MSASAFGILNVTLLMRSESTFTSA
jgi:hypothetical protein